MGSSQAPGGPSFVAKILNAGNPLRAMAFGESRSWMNTYGTSHANLTEGCQRHASGSLPTVLPPRSPLTLPSYLA